MVDEIEFQANNRLSFKEFVSLSNIDSIPDSTNIDYIRERLRKAQVMDKLFDKFGEYLHCQGPKSLGSQIIDAILIPFRSNALHARRTRKSNLGSMKVGLTTHIDCK